METTARTKGLQASEKALIAIQVIMSVMGIYYYTFIVARFYELLDESAVIGTVATYFMVAYGTIILTFLATARLIKRNSISVLRVGVIINVITLILMMKLDTVQFYPLIAVVFGVSQGLYYAPFSDLITKVTNGGDERVKSFCTANTILGKIAETVFPLTIGAYLDYAGFYKLITFFLIAGVIQIVITFLVKVEKKGDDTDFRLKEYLRKVKKSSNKSLKSYMGMCVCQGIVESVLDRMVVILVLLMYHTSFSLGIWSTVFAGVQCVVSAVVKKYYKPNGIEKAIVLSSIPTAVFVILLGISTRTTTFVFYKIGTTFSLAILSLIQNFARYTKQNEAIGFELEHQALTEILIGVGRIGGFGVVIGTMLIFNLPAIVTIKGFLYVSAVIMFLYGICARNVVKSSN